MSTNSDRARATVETRRREVFCAWLAALPAGGWAGTAGDLEEFLVGHQLRHGTSFPAGAGMSQWLRGMEDEIDAAGRDCGSPARSATGSSRSAPAVDRTGDGNTLPDGRRLPSGRAE